MELVRFISCEDDGTDQIVSFALADGEAGIKSLNLLRTPKFEVIMDESERGVSVSLEDETGDDFDILLIVRIEAKRVIIETHASKYELDISQVDPVEISEMDALIRRMNFDNRFRVEKI